MAELYYLTLKELESERDKLVNDFNDLKDKLVSVETSVNTMKNNLNALSGAIQQSEKLIKIASEHGKKDDWVEDFYKEHLKNKKKKGKNKK
jgi:hypothetical protein|tara:strand:+ start:421 stop:693 length:273 start_codon:yes stop_codon:yes gene_type:complete